MLCILSQPCVNNAICKDDLKGSFKCTCKPGYTGPNCETRNNKNLLEFFRWSPLEFCLLFEQPKELVCAHSKPCKNNGCCQDEDNGGYTCFCANGFIGKHCEIGRLFVFFPM